MKPSRFLIPVFLIALSLLLLRQDTDTRRMSHDAFILDCYSRLILPGQEENGRARLEFPEQAALQEFIITVDPWLQRVPAERRSEAWLAFMESRESFRSGSKSSLNWQEVSADMGGRTRALAWDPGDLNGRKIWAGAATGGLWYNEDIHDSTSTWVPVSGFTDYLPVSSIAFDPQNPQVMYVGTGEAQTALVIYRESSGLGSGILKSTDGGSSWNLLGPTQDFAYVTDVVTRVEAGQTVIYAGVVSGIYKGSTHSSQPSDGLFRSADGGQTWQQVLPLIAGSTSPYSVADIEIGADGRIFVGTMKNLAGNGGACILHSDSGSSGTWTLYNQMASVIQADPQYSIPGRVILAAAPSDPNTVYAAYGAGWLNSAGFNYARGRHILRTTNKGQTWTAVNLPQPTGGGDWATLSWHALTMGVDPNDPQTLYAGGLDQYRSTNHGLTWTHLSNWASMYNGGGPDYVHADQHKVLYFPGSSDTALFATDGGIFYTSNASAPVPEFKERNKGYNTLQFYTCAINHSLSQDSVLGGLQDNGTLLATTPPITVWDMVDGGDGAYCFFDDNDPVFYTSYYYNEYSIFVGGTYFDQTNTYGSGIFINPADYHSQGNTIYANACTFYGQNTDQMLRISGLPFIINDQILPLNTGTQVPFSFFGVSPHSTLSQVRLFVGSQSGRLFRVNNANTSPQSTDIGSTQFPAANISCVAVGGSDDTLLVSFSNYGVASVWLTQDGGNTWKDVEANLPDMPVRWALLAPVDANRALIATEMGIWSCDNLLSASPHWQVAGTGMPPVRTDMLRFRASDSTLVAATHGRGFWKSKWNLVNTSGLNDPPLSTFSLYPNPASDFVYIDGLKPGDLIRMFDLNGNLLWDLKPNTEQSALSLNGISPGTYFVEVISGAERIVRKLIVTR